MKIKKKIKKLFKLFNKCKKNKIVAVMVEELEVLKDEEEDKKFNPISFTESMKRRKYNEILRYKSYPQLSSDSSE